MLPETPLANCTTTKGSRIDRGRRSFRFGLRMLFASVAVVAFILLIVRYNRSTVGSGWSAISEGSPSKSHEFYFDAATALNAWLREQGFSPTDAPKLAFSKAPNAVWYEKIVDGSPIHVCIVASQQRLYVGVECILQAWPFQHAEGLPTDLKNSCGSISIAIGDWWREYKTKYRD